VGKPWEPDYLNQSVLKAVSQFQEEFEIRAELQKLKVKS